MLRQHSSSSPWNFQCFQFHKIIITTIARRYLKEWLITLQWLMCAYHLSLWRPDSSIIIIIYFKFYFLNLTESCLISFFACGILRKTQMHDSFSQIMLSLLMQFWIIEVATSQLHMKRNIKHQNIKRQIFHWQHSDSHLTNPIYTRQLEN